MIIIALNSTDIVFVNGCVAFVLVADISGVLRIGKSSSVTAYF